MPVHTSGYGNSKKRQRLEVNRMASGSPATLSRFQTNLTFVACSNPDEVKTPKLRRAIRSHITKRQHRLGGRCLSALPAGERQHPSYDGNGRLGSNDLLIDPLSERFVFPGAYELAITKLRTWSWDGTHSIGEQINSPGLPTNVRAGADVWSPYIVRYTISLENMGLDLPGLSTDERSSALQCHLFPLFFSDPTSFQVAALLAYAHYARATDQQADSTVMLHLRGRAMAGIRSALGNSGAGDSNATLVAIALMATYGALFGDRAYCTTHLSGLSHLLRVRARFGDLGPCGILERYLVFVDSNISRIVGCRRYLDAFHFAPSLSEIKHPIPHVERYAAGCRAI